nr:nucleotidyltransferase domain-containing protein [Gloeocapsa sp. PCC 7428]
MRDDFRPDSDIDVMVQFHPEAHPTFGSLDQMEAELKTIFRREIDLITRQGIETSRNYLRRHEILLLSLLVQQLDRLTSPYHVAQMV